ncbi:CAP domain-containing protein [Actinoplanes sp. URMC 104]|uniref:CAP domain-containing protein n=1 Tax=Actinoplanes sp. URMC 104 TaxID=3423409 RepID=UPI003F19B643
MSAAARFRYTLVAGATAVVIGGGFTFAGLTKDADAETTTVTTGAEQPLAADPGTPAAPLADTSAPPTLPPSPSASASPSVKPTTKAPATTAPARKKTQTTSPRPTPTKKKTKKPSTSAPQTSGSVAEQVLAHINAARKDEGLGTLSLDADLSRAAAIHTQLMIDGCGLSHQCPGEGGIGDRFSAQGVKWSAAAENIGYGSSGSSDAAKVQAANGLTDSMLAETPPNDGHRKNLLNPGLKRIGLSIVRDSKGVTWMTQDFVN